MRPEHRSTILTAGISAAILAACFGGVLTGNIYVSRWSVTDLITVTGLGLAAALMLFTFVKRVLIAMPEVK